jgi:hypothetical protein
MTARPLYVIAQDIATQWRPVNFAAKPYLDAMRQLDSVSDSFGADSARSIVLYFLSNATSWRGDVARQIKNELRLMVSSGAERRRLVRSMESDRARMVSNMESAIG